MVLQRSLGIGSGDDNANSVEKAEVAYVIRDAKTSYAASVQEKTTDGSADREFYGDSNGAEYHFVTSNGQVFTLPGYPVPQSDGTIEYHIDTQSGHYYVVTGNSGKAVDDTNVNGDVITNTKPIQASYISGLHGIDGYTGTAITTGLSIAPNARKVGA